MTALDALAIAGVGLVAGTMNAVVGSGSLITFPTLLALGYPPVLANVSNKLGLVPGNASGAWGYRPELRTQSRRRLAALALLGAAGGGGGAALLLVTPSDSFQSVVPWLILLATVLVVVQPWISRRVAARGRGEAGGAVLAVALGLAAIYGGYFGAGQGVLYLSTLAILLAEDLQHLNAVKNLLGVVVNGVAALVFVSTTDVDFAVAGLLAAGSVVGGRFGVLVARRLPPLAFRVIIVAVGTAATVRLLV